jgi:hypothetical protein
MTRTRLSTWLLCAVAIAAVLSHVCALPHAHADEPGAIAHEHDDERDAADDDAAHGASCEVLRVSPPLVPVLASTAASITAHVERASGIVARAPAVVAGGPSPPLFLVHAALLI